MPDQPGLSISGVEEPTIVILTALNLEQRPIRQYLEDTSRFDHPAGTVFEIGRLPGSPAVIVLAVAGVGNVAAAVIAERAIATFQPRALFVVGVAGALRDEIALGDVVVATKVYAYHGGAARETGFEARPRSWETSHQLDQIARHVHRTESWTSRLPRHDAIPGVHFGPVAAGEVLLDARSGPLFQQLRRTYGDAVAIEMESAGIAQAGHLNDALPVLTVRGISDRAEGNKSAADQAGWQPVAAVRAAAFALTVVADLCADPRSSRSSSGIVAR